MTGGDVSSATPAPRCTIVVLTHDRRESLDATLRFLSRLPECPPIIVVDNGSRDGTVAFLRATWPEIHVIALDENVGAAARNAGVRAATTDYVAFCDDDGWWEPGSLALAARLLDAYDRVALVHASVLVRGAGLDPVSALMAVSRVPKRTACPGRAILQFMAGWIVIRRDAFLEAGGFDPRFFIGAEEALLAIDLLERRWDMMYVPDLVAHHAPSETSRDPFARRTFVYRNRLWTTWLRRSSRHVVSSAVAFAIACARDRAARAAIVPALRGIPWIRRERRVVRPDVERLMAGITTLPA